MAVTTNLLLHFATLKTQLALLEDDLNLARCTPDEVNIICALACLSSGTGSFCAVSDLREHPLCNRMTKPTFYRALASLAAMGWITKAEGARSGLYALARQDVI